MCLRVILSFLFFGLGWVFEEESLLQGGESFREKTEGGVGRLRDHFSEGRRGFFYILLDIWNDVSCDLRVHHFFYLGSREGSGSLGSRRGWMR